MLPDQWTTERLLLRDVTAADTAQLLAIFNANAHIGGWDPTFQPIAMSEMAGVVADNWPALRMWVKGGFDRIVKFQGDPVLTPEGNADVVLEQFLQHTGAVV